MKGSIWLWMVVIPGAPGTTSASQEFLKRNFFEFQYPFECHFSIVFSYSIENLMNNGELCLGPGWYLVVTSGASNSGAQSKKNARNALQKCPDAPSQFGHFSFKNWGRASGISVGHSGHFFLDWAPELDGNWCVLTVDPGLRQSSPLFRKFSEVSFFCQTIVKVRNRISESCGTACGDEDIKRSNSVMNEYDIESSNSNLNFQSIQF